MRLAFPLILAAACTLPGVDAEAAEDADIEALRVQLRQRDAEIDSLRREIAAMRRQRQRLQANGAALPRPPDPPPARASATAPSRPSPAPPGGSDEDDMLASALESALVRQGVRVLTRGTKEIEPELSYFYDEPIQRQRRDNFGAALTARVGLPWAMQAEVRVPYVISDRWTEVGTSSGIGDVRLGLTKELVSEREWVPSILAFAQWRTTTGDVNRNPPTGFGQNGIQVGASVVKRQDPIVLFGSLSYTAYLGSAHLRSGSRLDAGDAFGGKLGAFLAVTPDISLLLAVSANSFSADRFDGFRIAASDRMQGVVEIGGAVTIGRGLFLNVTAGVGVTPAAPNFALTVSVPYRF